MELQRLVHRASGLTDTGRIRENNEDSYSIDEDLGLYVVSDGIGGGLAGEKASEIVVRALPMLLKAFQAQNPYATAQEALQHLGQAVVTISIELREHASQFSEYRGAGATLLAAQVLGGSLLLAHLGDSRAYRLRKGVFERLTGDHSIVDALYRAGTIKKRQLKSHPARGVVTQYAGMAGEAKPDLTIVSLEEGDRILLCSDGLTGMLSERLIGRIMLEFSTIEEQVDRLVEGANLAGGRDNITVVLISFGEERIDNSDRLIVKKWVNSAKKQKEV
jgi:protein phosphatase